MSTDTTQRSDIKQLVNERYGSLAIHASEDSQRGVTHRNSAAAFGYTDAEIRAIPETANLGLSCGNPIAIANLRKGEVVIDLGSGGGFDVFIAAGKVGKDGKVIGVDMNDEMIALARSNASKHAYGNVEFVTAAITSVPLDSSMADCIISNCVVNLVPQGEKHLVFKEMYRLLKTGGRVAVGDLLARKPLPENVRLNVAAYVGCIAGAAEVSDYESWLREAGFDDIVIVDTKQDTNIYGSQRADQPVCDPGARDCCERSSLPGSTLSTTSSLADYDLNEWIGSFKIFTVKS